MLRVLVALIACAIVVQNTCPYGYAGKTAVAAPHVHDCPLKARHKMPDGRNRVRKDFQDPNNPFALVLVAADGAFETFAPAREASIAKYAGLRDIFLNPPHRPPEG